MSGEQPRRAAASCEQLAWDGRLLWSAALLARDTDDVVRVVLERHPGSVAQARAAAHAAGVCISVDIRGSTIAIRFSAHATE